MVSGEAQGWRTWVEPLRDALEADENRVGERGRLALFDATNSMGDSASPMS